MFTNEKKKLRAAMKLKLAALNADERSVRSDAILTRLLATDLYQNSNTILAYASFGSEVQTDALLERVLKDKKTLVLPRLKPAGHSLALHVVKDLSSDLLVSKFHIREPRPDLPRFRLEQIPLLLVPGLAFDEYGSRLGRGLGCYDRLLANSTEDNTVVALAFETQIVGGVEIPEEDNDMPMDMIITESRIIDRRDVFDMLKKQELQNG